MSAQPGEAYDRELGLDELLPAADRARILDALSALAGVPLRVLHDDGSVCVDAGGTYPDPRREPLHWELETIGFVEGCASAAALQAAKRVLEQLFRAHARYHMASALHLTTVLADYEVLQEQHQALQQSESRYRALASELEQRVAVQVAEIETTQRTLYQNEKLASVGRLAAGVAHEINNPIGFVRSNLNSAAGYLDELAGLRALCVAGTSTNDPLTRYWHDHDLDTLLTDFHELLDECKSGTDRVTRIVADLKLFSQVDREASRSTDPSEIIRSACAMLRLELPAGSRLLVEETALPHVHCHPGRIGEALFNLLQNAAQALDGKGTLRIGGRAAGDRLEIVVEDDGCGIPPEMLDRIFDPFFTTRAVGAGTGLGLTIARDIANAHGGALTIESTPGVGTRAVLALPREQGATDG